MAARKYRDFIGASNEGPELVLGAFFYASEPVSDSTSGVQRLPRTRSAIPRARNLHHSKPSKGVWPDFESRLGDSEYEDKQ